MEGLIRDDRAAVQLVDVALTFFVFVALMVLSPYFYHFIGMAAAEADPFTSVLMRLVVPLLFAALIASVGVSARGGS